MWGDLSRDHSKSRVCGAWMVYRVELEPWPGSCEWCGVFRSILSGGGARGWLLFLLTLSCFQLVFYLFVT